MTPQMHTELTALIDRYDREEITDEEWALLQIHMAYCESCKVEFEVLRLNGAVTTLEQAALEGRRARGEPD